MNLREILSGYLGFFCLSAFVKLEIPELLAKEPHSIEEMARHSKSSTGHLMRLLKYLSLIDIVAVKDEKFSLTKKGKYLLKNHPGNLASSIEFFTSPLHLKAWGELSESIKSGSSSVELEYKKSLFEYLSDNEDEARFFNHAMSTQTDLIQDIAQKFSNKSYQTITDIGGGRGALLKEFIKKYPSAVGIIFDLPHVINGISIEEKFDNSIANRIGLMSGDFFCEIPIDSDLYILKLILHDWSNDDCNRILSNLWNACSEKSSVLVIERLLEYYDPDEYTLLMDLEMMALTPGGRERNIDEFTALFGSAGFEIHDIVSLTYGFSGMLLKKKCY